MVKIRRSDQDVDGGEISPQEFEKLLQESAQVESVHAGEIVSGSVVSVTKEWVFVDIGSKAEGMIALAEFEERDGTTDIRVGDEVEAAVLSTRGGILLSRSLKRSQQTSGILYEAYANRIPVEGKVKEIRKGGYGIELGGADSLAFCPISQIDSKFVEKPEEHLEKEYSFRLIEYSEGGRNVVVSRRVLLEEEAEANARELRERLVVGMILDGTVRRIMPYGAFVDIGGMDGLVHVSEISWDRIENPADYLTEGQHVKVKLLSYEAGKDKMSLSIREAGADPWDDVEQRFPVSTSVSGSVTRVESYGAFVRIAQGIEGLVHISDMTWAGRVRHASDVVSAGDSVQVVVMGIEKDRKRISLGMKQVQGDPFSGAAEKYVKGNAVKGAVQRIAAGGIFVELEEGIVAFLPGSLSGVGRGEPLGSVYKVGKVVDLIVREVDLERRRITLEAGEAMNSEEQKEFESYMKQQKVEKSSGGLGSFGELLQKALDGKPRKGF